MAAYPAVYDIEQPEKYDRVQIAIRILIAIILSVLAGAIGWAYGLIYLAVPVVAAILISQKGAPGYLQESGTTMTKWLGYLVAFQSYMSLLTDRLPTEDVSQIMRFEVRPEGNPTPGSAILRIITAIPSAFVLALISILAAILTIIAAIMILVQETYPASIFNFLRGTMRWHVRLLAYIASLTGEYPPFALDTGPEGPPAAAAPDAPAPTA